MSHHDGFACAAVNYCGDKKRYTPHSRLARGEPCPRQALPGDTLCWVHRKTVIAGAATEDEVRRGVRKSALG